MATIPNFDDTEIAFQARSDRDLYESYLVFKSLGIRPLVNLGTGLISKALALHLPITPLVRFTIFKQFCGGVDAQDCFPIVERLGRYGVRSILDYSVEARESDHEMDAVVAEICHTMTYGRDLKNIPFAVFKVTGIFPIDLLEKQSAAQELSSTEKVRWQKGLQRFRTICEKAHQHNVRLLVDAEETWIQPAIDELVQTAMRENNKDRPLIYNTLQMYLSDRLDYLQRLFEDGESQGYHVGVKLVRGAYMEKERERAKSKGYPSPVQPDKASTDRDFDAAVENCLNRINQVGLFIGTHNEASTRRAAQLMIDKNISPQDERVYFSQLYGMSDNLSFNLAQHGYLAAKYLPYGPVKAVLPYLFRRAQENSSIQGQAGRELQLIERELQRRKRD